MSSDLDLRGIHRFYDPDPEFVERLRLLLEEALDGGADAGGRADPIEVPLAPAGGPDRAPRRRVVLAAAAIVVVIAAAGGALWLRSDDTEPTGFTDATNPFIGTWESIDTDGSSQTMEVTGSAEDGFEVVIHDELAGVCSSAPATMIGTGRLDGDRRLVVEQPALTCDDGSAAASLDGRPLQEVLAGISFVYDPSADRLVDNMGNVVWWRAGAEDARPDPVAGGWPQSSLEEAHRAQALAYDGDPAYTWQMDAELAGQEWWVHLRDSGSEVVERFLREELGWEHFLFNPYVGDDGDGMLDGAIRGIVYLRCEPGQANPLYPDPPEGHQEAPGSEGCAPTIDGLTYESVRFDLIQPARQGPRGIWVVTRWAAAEPFAMVDPEQAVEEATARAEQFLSARVAGEGAEQHAPVVDQHDWMTSDLPLLYATSSGSRYERFEIERLSGPAWPYGDMELTARLFADGGATVVEHPMRWSGFGGEMELTPVQVGTTENGRPVPVRYELWEGVVSVSAAAPWDVRWTFGVSMTRDEPFGDERIDFVLDPRAGAALCDVGPVPAGAGSLAASIRSNPDLVTTEPAAVSIGGTAGLWMDVELAGGAGQCLDGSAPRVVEDVTGWQQIGLQHGHRLRIYLVDLPDGSAGEVLAIGVSAPGDVFDDVLAEADPVVESVELHAEAP